MSAAAAPRVSVGIPTYNRVGGLRRAVESALDQAYPDLEVVISDNASTDGTRDYCEGLAARDPRVRYLRQAENRGLVPNFLEVLHRASGPYFCWLADDDQLGPGSLPHLVAYLESHPECALAVGRVLTLMPGGAVEEEPLHDLLQEEPQARTRAYYGQIGANAYIYGVARRDLLLRCPFEVRLGNDWNLMASLVFLGQVKTLEGASLVRHAHGASKDIWHLARVMGAPRMQHLLPLESLVAGVYGSIARRSPVFAPLGFFGRRRLALRCAATVAQIYLRPHWAAHLRGWFGLRRPLRDLLKGRPQEAPPGGGDPGERP